MESFSCTLSLAWSMSKAFPSKNANKRYSLLWLKTAPFWGDVRCKVGEEELLRKGTRGALDLQCDAMMMMAGSDSYGGRG